LKDISLSLREGQKLAVFSDYTKSANALLECASEVAPLQSGKVEIRGNVSWPMPSRGALDGVMTGRQNAKFLQAVYGNPTERREEIARIEELAALEPGCFDQPLKSWGPQMRGRFDVAMSLIFDFDVYIISKKFPWSQPSKPQLESQVREAFESRIAGKAMLLFHQDEEFLGRYCDEAIVINKSQIVYQGAFTDAQKWFHLNVSKSQDEDDTPEQESEDASSPLIEESLDEVQLW
jgi:capsular polysaccharide transport system ATP-binding protein